MPETALGLTESEAEHRLAARPPEPDEHGRSTASIVRANVITPFNAVLVVLGVLELAFGNWRDALFLGIVVANSAIGIWQELRAKRKLDRLAALVAPSAAVVRDGVVRHVSVGEVVAGDVVQVQAGDQVVADGPLVVADALELDESVLTGESRAVRRQVGDDVRSGSFVVEGAGAYEVRDVGAASYAERIAGEAREFRHPRSPLEQAVNRLLYILSAAMVPLALLLIAALWKQDIAFDRAVSTAVAGMVTLIPEGLFLLVSITFAAASVALARRGALAQQLNAIESLASVEVLCLDKTGTLTTSTLRVVEAVPTDGFPTDELETVLGRFAAASPVANPTIEALRVAYPHPPETPVEAVPFSSRRRWSGVRVGGRALVLGAPELFTLALLERQARDAQSAGRRVVAIGVVDSFPADDAELRSPRLLGLVVIAEELRADARETVAFLRAEGVELKVLSGDDPGTVASIAADAGIPLRVPAIAESELPTDPAELAQAARRATVIGRISPAGKRRVVESLRDQGYYVAMVGDGVNDVPALKAARLAIAQGSGTQMAKAVSDVVLVSGDFGSVPRMVAEGRKILRNIQRVAKLFVSKSVFAAFLILAIGLTPTEYPLLPRHLTLVAALTVGIPAFFLALAPSSGPWRTDRFLREIGRFSVPAGVAAGLGVVVTYLVTLNVFGLDLVEARTAATTTLVVVGLYLVLALEARGAKRASFVGGLCVSLAIAYVLVLAIPATRSFFDLVVPGLAALLMVAVGSALAIGFLWLTDDRFVPRFRAAEDA